MDTNLAEMNKATEALMHRFNDAFMRHDPRLLDDIIAEDCILENTTPAPNGSRHVGRAACIELWTGIASNLEGNFECEKIIPLGERAIILWRYRWGPSEADSVRGVELVLVRDGKIVEALGYVKSA